MERATLIEAERAAEAAPAARVTITLSALGAVQLSAEGGNKILHLGMAQAAIGLLMVDLLRPEAPLLAVPPGMRVPRG